jgi:hypothetical protein
VIVPSANVAYFLNERHYLGSTQRGFAWSDDFGVIVFAKPTARRLPQDGTWLEVVRWCLVGVPNGGSQQWARAWRAVVASNPEVLTFVSYSDPSVGHTGALYRACNWTWAPTWHRLFPPPSGNGSWKNGERQSVKDRWVFPVKADPARAEVLRVKDGRAVAALFPPPDDVGAVRPVGTLRDAHERTP